ncbi:hypothetical protein [Thioalkalivibrio sp. XN279]|uniref:hypothetical protein n=1 Tax=Thioalkalivibrio sp. XN279 TaxID=2714953 RepID=UPI0014073A7D|nr:hypothetical protein [Thioalkalivibrio sp. XN279]NHA13987.1 hypothetical protein [Thioalkalivibrio sp. XN279]
MRTKTVLATLLLTTLGLPLAATAEDFTNWSLTFINSDGTPAGSGSFRADADIQYRTPALDIDITVNGVEYDFTFSPGTSSALYFNNFTGGVGGYALSSNEDGTQIPCIGFGTDVGGRWDYFLCTVSGGEFGGAERLSTYGYFSVKDASEIWRDNFERPGASNTVGNDWTEIEANPESIVVALGPGPGMIVKLWNVRDGEPDAAIRRMISTAGYENIELTFAYQKGLYAFSGDALKVYYTVDGGTNWTLITSLDLVSAPNWIVWSGPVGQAAANAPGFGISLETEISDEDYSWLSHSKGANINYVVINGTPATADGPPVVSDVAASDVVFPADVILTATATDTESNIVSAEYLRDGSASGDMSAADGAFDGTSEDLTATLTGLMVKTHEVCVTATDQGGNTSDGTVCDTFDVTAAQLEVGFVGQLLDIDGAPTELTAEVTGPCSSGADVEFFADSGSGYESQGTAEANTSGVATLKDVFLPVGIHDITVEVGDQDLGGDSAPECTGDSDTGITVVADTRASSTGGGWYKIDSLTPPRVNFGYTAQTKYNKKLDEYSTSGNLLWMHQDNYRLKGVINAGGKLPDEACPAGFSTCAAFAGEGTLYQHNPAYDPDCEEPYGCEPEWINAIANNPFIFFVNDGGVVLECLNKKKCKEVEQADQFGIEIALESLDAESDPVYLNGGNLVVR